MAKKKKYFLPEKNEVVDPVTLTRSRKATVYGSFQRNKTYSYPLSN